MANHSLLDYVNDAISYIESNVKSELSLERISEDLFISKFYLNRLFSAITGRKLMSYATNRKLMSSLNELLNTDMRILDIALEYGYNFEKSYIRAFKREFGITPKEFRKTKCELNTAPVIDISDLTAIGEHSIIIKPTLVVKPAFFVIGNRLCVDKENYLNFSPYTDFANDFYYNKRPLINGCVSDQSYYGHVLYGDPNNYYTSCVEVESDALPPEGMVKFQIPANKYWVFKYLSLCAPERIAYMDFVHVFSHMAKWFEFAGHEWLGTYHFENVNNHFIGHSYCELDLYFPILEKTVTLN